MTDTVIQWDNSRRPASQDIVADAAGYMRGMNDAGAKPGFPAGSDMGPAGQDIVAGAADYMRGMKDIETKSGFRCRLSPKVVDDWDLVVLAAKAGKGGAATIDYITYVLSRTFDQDTSSRLTAHCTEDGRIVFSRLLNEIEEIMGRLQDPN